MERSLRSRINQLEDELIELRAREIELRMFEGSSSCTQYNAMDTRNLNHIWAKDNRGTRSIGFIMETLDDEKFNSTYLEGEMIDRIIEEIPELDYTVSERLFKRDLGDNDMFNAVQWTMRRKIIDKLHEISGLKDDVRSDERRGVDERNMAVKEFRKIASQKLASNVLFDENVVNMIESFL
jgi:hypothetical protein